MLEERESVRVMERGCRSDRSEHTQKESATVNAYNPARFTLACSESFTLRASASARRPVSRSPNHPHVFPVGQGLPLCPPNEGARSPSDIRTIRIPTITHTPALAAELSIA